MIRSFLILATARIFVLLLVAMAAGGCHKAEPTGFKPLWKSEWLWFHHGESWIQGVEADGRQVPPAEGQQRLRAAFVNIGDGPARAAVHGRTEYEWRLDPGERQFIDISLDPEGNEISASPNVVLVAPRTGRELAEPRLLVFLLVDTLRADHMTAELAPNITGFFAAGRRFTNATANASWTLPSVASMFTSRPVLELTSPAGDLIAVPEGAATWATSLDDAGFAGAAAVANYSVAVLNGFGAGFSSFWVPDGRGGAPHSDATWVVERGRRWLSERTGEDSFLYLHLMDPHHPYRSHEHPDLEVPDLISLANRQRLELPGEREILAGLYAGEIRHLDSILGPFLDQLPESAVVIFTSDHGESLGERGCWGHGLNLYQESLAVPLFIRGPGIESGIDQRLVHHLDTAPTVLELMGLSPAPSMTGSSLFADIGARDVISTTFGSGPLRWAWRRGDDKTILRTAAQPGLGAEARSRLREGSPLESGLFHYDLAADPGETRPQEVDPDLLAEAGAAFAASAGRLVPGFHVQLWAHPGSHEIQLTGIADPEVVQAWCTAPVTVTTTTDGLDVQCDDAAALCAVAVSTTSARGAGSVLVDEQEAFEVELESSSATGAWWNDARELVVKGHEETLERLRALGYID